MFFFECLLIFYCLWSSADCVALTGCDLCEPQFSSDLYLDDFFKKLVLEKQCSHCIFSALFPPCFWYYRNEVVYVYSMHSALIYMTWREGPTHM